MDNKKIIINNSISTKWLIAGKKLMKKTKQVIMCLIIFIIWLSVQTILYTDHSVQLFAYKFELNHLKKTYGIDKFSHFPASIPLNAKNYYFNVEHGWDNSVDLLYFDIDKKYIEKFESKYKNKCKVLGKKSDVFSKYTYPHIGIIDDNDELCMFLEPSYKKRYLRGYAVNKKKNRIYFFYENW